MASNCIGRAVRFLCGVAVAMTAAIVAAADRPKLAPAQEGMLDCVLCIDNSGSMADEIEAVQQAVAEFIRDLKTFAGQNKIRLQFGLVTFARHGDPGWLQSWSLTSDAELIRRNILAMRIVDPRRGAGGREDMYAALMYAMDATVGGESIAMGWRSGAAKIILVAGDEAPDEPDWEARTLADVADRAEKLDPVHIYTLILPGQGPGFLDPTVRAISRLADATAGEAMRRECEDAAGCLDWRHPARGAPASGRNLARGKSAVWVVPCHRVCCLPGDGCLCRGSRGSRRSVSPELPPAAGCVGRATGSRAYRPKHPAAAGKLNRVGNRG